MFLEHEGGKGVFKQVFIVGAVNRLWRDGDTEIKKGQPCRLSGSSPGSQLGIAVLQWDVNMLAEHQPQTRSLWDHETVRHSKATSQLGLSPDKTRFP